MAIEQAGIAIGRAITAVALRKWTNQRQSTSGRGKDLTELISVTFRDQFHRRSIERQLESLADQVSQRLAPFYSSEFSSVDEGDRIAALQLAIDCIGNHDLTDSVLFATDLNAKNLAAEIRKSGRRRIQKADLGDSGTALFDLLLDDSCIALIELARSLPQFDGRALSEALERLSETDRKLAEILQRIPLSGKSQDSEEMNSRYMQFCSDNYDELQIFGLDTRRFRLRSRVSVAYMTLSARTNDDRLRKLSESRRDSGWASNTAFGAITIEDALSVSPRTIIFGSAGSGKTTLLQWVSINAARGTFTGPLTSWNGRIPFLLRLRSLTDNVTPPIADLTKHIAPGLLGFRPQDWEHSVIEGGRALLFVDGLDELASPHRRAVRDWLRSISTNYPQLPIIVTTRPAAVEHDWMSEHGFTSVTLDPMSVTDVLEFSHRWHNAVRSAANAGELSLPCGVEELGEYESSLARQLNARPHLMALATNPLLCAMLCALNLDRSKHLPPDRMALYGDAIRMLVERRDAERDVLANSGTPQMKMTLVLALLRQLAWRLTLAGRAEMSTDLAQTTIELVCQTKFPTVQSVPKEILQFLIERSGVLRSPTVDRIDFVHKTFQEYLAASEAINEHYIDVLIENSSKDGWREVVVMAAGHATQPLRRQLIDGILEISSHGGRRARKLKLLAAECLETAGEELSIESNKKVEAAIGTLLPPKRLEEARSLAIAGATTLRRMPSSLAELSDAAAAASVDTVAFVGGSAALSLLAKYASDDRVGVQRRLIQAWRYFDPATYAQEVLAEAPLEYGVLHIDRVEYLPLTAHLSKLKSVSFTGSTPTLSSLRDLEGVPLLHRVSVRTNEIADIAHLVEHQNLTWLQLFSSAGIDNAHLLSEFRSLDLLALRKANCNAVVDAVQPLVDTLRILTLEDDTGTFSSLDKVANLHGLEALDLWGVPNVTDITPLSSLLLEHFSLDGDSPNIGLDSIASNLPRLKFLNLHAMRTPGGVQALTSLQLDSLWFNRCNIGDLSPLSSMETLRDVALSNCEIENLSALADLPRLRRLDVRSSVDILNISPFLKSDRKGVLDIWINPGQLITGAESLSGSRLKFTYM